MIGAWFHCFSGIAGDMALGSLLDAGADVDEVRGILDALPVEGWDLHAEDVLRGGIGGTKAHVRLTRSTVVRTAASIDALLVEATLPDRVRTRARTVFGVLARVEGHLHRKPAEQVHFHEVGSLDAIVDIVGTCAALEVLGIDEVRAGTVTTGMGMVRAAHGLIPNPAPATVELLRGAPTRGIDESVELTTPTGAALLAGLVTEWGPLPEMTITATGFGAGTRELDGRANLTQVVVGELATPTLGAGQDTWLLETNLDDVTGEVLAHAVEALIAAGAHDAWLTPVLMKKGRPGHVLHALVDVALADQVRRVMVAETGTLGVRGRLVDRWSEPRHFATVALGDASLAVKVGPGRAKIELDDAAAVAQARDVPLREVLESATAAWLVNQRAGSTPALHHVRNDATSPIEHAHRHEHEPGHDHSHEPGDDHGHSHEPGNDHGHSHEHDHLHAHGDHTHEHGHAHAHGDTHDDRGRGEPPASADSDAAERGPDGGSFYEEGPADPAS